MRAQVLKAIDSLQNELINISSENQKKTDLLNQIGYNYWVVDSQKSIDYGERALKLSQELSYDAGVAMARRVLGVAYWTLEKSKLALENLTESQKNMLKSMMTKVLLIV